MGPVFCVIDNRCEGDQGAIYGRKTFAAARTILTTEIATSHTPFALLLPPSLTVPDQLRRDKSAFANAYRPASTFAEATADKMVDRRHDNLYIVSNRYLSVLTAKAARKALATAETIPVGNTAAATIQWSTLMLFTKSEMRFKLKI